MMSVRKRRSPLAALVAVLAVLLAVPFERGRPSDVCPVDCPMHAARRVAGHVGCHHAAAPTRRTAANDACALCAACGHHFSAALVAFHAELPAEQTDRSVEPRRLRIVVAVVHGIGVQPPRARPPKPVLV